LAKETRRSLRSLARKNNFVAQMATPMRDK